MKNFIRKTLDRISIWNILIRYPKLRSAYGIESHLTTKEKYQLFKLASGKESILEIGSYLGASATCFASQLASHAKGKIYCIDTWQNDSMTEGKRDTFIFFRENTKQFSNYIIPIQGYSTQVVDVVEEKVQDIDLLFIDGDHSYEGVKADWESYKKFLSEGSVIVFHDIGWAEGVIKVVEEDVKPNVSSFDSLPNLWWGIIDRKL